MINTKRTRAGIIRSALLTGAAATALTLGAGAAMAEEEDTLGLEFSATTTFATDYVFRGVSQTDNGPAIQGSFDVSHDSGIYAGVWASNVDFTGAFATDDGANIEVDYYVGWAYDWADTGISSDVGFLYYQYPGAQDSLDYDYWEIFGALGYTAADLVDLGVAFYWADDFFGGTGEANYLQLSAGVPIGDMFGIDGHYGFNDFDAGGDYDDWSVGVTASYLGFDFDLRYTDTDINGGGSIAGEKITFAASRTF